MISTLTSKMPTEVRTKFESIALQVQLTVVTTARLRKALEEKRNDEIWSSLEDSDTAGITQQILKRAIVHASEQVAKTRKTHESWARNTDLRIQRLLKAGEEAERTQAQLSVVQAQLESFGVTQNGKSTKVVEGLIAGREKALMATTFGAWKQLQVAAKSEKE